MPSSGFAHLSKVRAALIVSCIFRTVVVLFRRSATNFCRTPGSRVQVARQLLVLVQLSQVVPHPSFSRDVVGDILVSTSSGPHEEVVKLLLMSKHVLERTAVREMHVTPNTMT